MRLKSFSTPRLQYMAAICLIILFIWISFSPSPILQKYQLYTNLSFIFIFIIFFIHKGVSILQSNDYPLWIFLIAISINVFFAQDRIAALKTYLDLAIPMFCIYYLVSEVLFSGKSFVLLAKTICFCSILISLGGIFESLFAFNPIYEYFIKNPCYLKNITGFVRPMSTQLDATVLGGFLLGCLPFSFILFKKSILFLKLLGAVGIVLNTVVIVLTLSRAALLGLIVIIALYLLVEKRYRIMTIFLIIAFVFSAAFSYLPYPFSKLGLSGIIKPNLSPSVKLNIFDLKPMIEEHSLDKSYNFEEFGRNWIYEDSVFSNYRLARLNMALRMAKDYPFAGIGFQHFRIRFYEYYPHKQQIFYDIMIADNMYLTILSETGIIGFLGFFIFVISLLKKGWKKLTVLNYNSDKWWLLSGGLAAFLGLLINMAGYEFFYWPNQYILFCIIIGFINACLNNLKSEVNSENVLSQKKRT